MTVDLARAEAVTRRAYELGRAKRAGLFAAPVVILAALAGMLGDVPVEAMTIGALLYFTAGAFYWRGQQLGAAVVPGIAAGLVPLALGLLMRAHGCMGGGCMRVCVPICAGAGVVGGLLIAGAALQRAMRAPYLVGAGTVALLTGALGCACMGFGGLGGLAAGMAIPVAAGLVRVATARAG